MGDGGDGTGGSKGGGLFQTNIEEVRCWLISKSNAN